MKSAMRRKHNHTKSLVAISLGLLVSACGEGNAPTAQSMPAVPVVVQTATPTDIPLTTEMVGETAGFREIEVRARVGGILLKRTYEEGRPVSAGQELFQIDPEPYQISLEQAKGVLAQEKARLNKTRADKDRIIPLFKRQVLSRKDYDEAIANYEAALASYQSAQAKVKAASINLGYTQVTAPIDGMASKSSQSEGSLIATSGESSLLTTITQYDPLYVNFSYSEQDRLNLETAVKSGKIEAKSATDWRTHIKLADGSTYPEAGQLNFSDTRVDPTTGTIRARAIFDNKDGALLPGQFVRLTIDLGTRKDAIVVPPRAIVQSQADRLIMVVDAKNQVVPRPVKLGQTVHDGIIIESGLQPGDRYIVEGLMKVRPGAEVKPVSADEMKAINAQVTQGAAGK